jgi:hypothetical protein
VADLCPRFTVANFLPTALVINSLEKSPYILAISLYYFDYFLCDRGLFVSSGVEVVFFVNIDDAVQAQISRMVLVRLQVIEQWDVLLVVDTNSFLQQNEDTPSHDQKGHRIQLVAA